MCPRKGSPRRANHEGTVPRLRKDGRWMVNVMLGGDFRSAYGKTAAEARRNAKRLVESHQAGADTEGAKTPLAAFLNKWLETSVRRRRENTYLSYEIAVRVHIIPHPAERPLGGIALGKLHKDDIEAWIEDRRAVVAPYTLWRLHAILRAGLNRAVKCEPPILRRNPASMVEAIEHDDDEIDPLTAVEARKVLVSTEGTPAHALYAVALGLGLREGEILGLRWADRANDPGIDLDRGEVRVYQQLQHGRLAQLKRSWHRRVLPLSPWLVAVLDRHRDLLADQRQLAGGKWREHGLVFPSQVGTPQRAANVWMSWKRLLKRIEIGDHTVHDLRHTFATLALDAGVPLWKVSKMLGHRDITITLKTYGHLTHEGREDVAERMEGMLAPRLHTTKVKTKVNILSGTPNEATSELEMTPFVLPVGE